jgi:hypothetical protein
MVKTRNN